MKTKKILSLIISVLMLLSCISVSAATFPPKNSEVWTNLTDEEADDLLKSKNESFIFFFYRDTCLNSQSSISAIIEYAKENNMSLCGLNTTEYPTWQTWVKYIKSGQTSISFPFVIIHNGDTNVTVAQDNVLTVRNFEKLLDQAYMLPDDKEEDKEEDKKSTPDFKDVASGSKYYAAVKQLAGEGVLTGYEDGTFKPDNTITRTEAAVVIVRAGKLSTANTKKSIFTDVSDAFWGKDYIMAASQAGIINGMGDGIFAPQDKVTRYQLIKMIVCLAGLEKEAVENGGWPNGYAIVARLHNIIDAGTFSKINTGSYGSEPATRGEAAQWIYNTRKSGGATTGEAKVEEKVETTDNDGFEVAGKVLKLGMSASELDKADESMYSVNNFVWNVYGTKDYKNFYAVGVMYDKVVALAAAGNGFKYKGYSAGDTLNSASDNSGEFLLDPNDGNIIHGVFLIDDEWKNVSMINIAGMESESKMNFHFTNAFRVFHKMPILKWDKNAAEAARLHSSDMAMNKYFNHTGLDGKNMGDRMRAQGVNWTACSENIHAGSKFGIDAYNAWVNSSGHRKNMLGTYTYLGVGFAYNEFDQFKFYSTQNFYEQASAFSTFFN